VAGKPASAAEALTLTLALADDELRAALADLEAQLARGSGPGEVRLGAGGELVIPPLTAGDVPAGAGALRAELGALLPRVPIASVLAEADARTGFTGHLVHAGGKVARPPELKRNLLYVIIAEAANMGLGAMAESPAACPMTCWPGPPSGTSAARRWRRPTPRASTTTAGSR